MDVHYTMRMNDYASVYGTNVWNCHETSISCDLL